MRRRPPWWRGFQSSRRRSVTYRGVTVEEMDLDAILARKPAVAVVDELAHTNLPVCRNRKRYQDVQELLSAGISVIGAFNVQHLESLNDVVERATGVEVRETLPDTFLQQADQVVNLDLAVEDLQERLRAGKIYQPDKVPQALERFFQHDNLVTLRELALREVAESLERTAAGRPAAESAAHPAAGRVMVCLSSFPPHAAAPLAPRLAGRGSPQHRLVRGLRGDALGGAEPHRRRGPAAPVGQHRESARSGGGGGATPGEGPRTGPARLRAQPRGGPPPHRALAGAGLAQLARSHHRLAPRPAGR